MNTAEQITRLQNENARLRNALRDAIRGDAQQKHDAEALLLMIELDRHMAAAPASKRGVFDIAAEICAEPFRRPTFPQQHA